MKGKTNLKIVVTKIMMTRFNQNTEIGTYSWNAAVTHS
jgi:hypothetical protein